MFVESKGIERDILLLVNKKPKSISEISKELNKSIQIISKTIERMKEQDLINKIHEYGKDARKTEVSINPKRIKIERTHTFYLAYFTLSIIPLIISLILSLIFKKLFLIIGCFIGVLPPILFILYQSYIKEDKTIVYKNQKIIKKKTEIKEERR